MNHPVENGNGFIAVLAKTCLLEKCSILPKLIDESNVKVLHQHFPALVNQIFDIGCSGWGLKCLQQRSVEFNRVREFLGSRGPMMRMALKLQADNMLFRYELPCSMLPPSFFQQYSDQHLLQRSSRGLWPMSTGILGSSQIGPASQGIKSQACIRVSAFEFYFYHFAAFVLSPVAASVPMPQSYGFASPAATAADDKLYFVLLDDYLNHFLPADGSRPPVMQLPNSAAQVPTRTSPWMNRASSLLRKSPVKQTNSFGFTQNEIWLSDMLIRIFVEFWLGQCTVQGNGQTLSAPTEDLVISVRHMVKHMHYFANANSFSLSHSGLNDSILEQFRQNITCNCLQPRLLEFLSYFFDIWPLNPSFRLVLETWLSYIQPWRYTDLANTGSNAEMRLSQSRDIANIWYPFVSRNLLFYNSLFRAVVRRFLCTDLSNHANSLLLYRVAKIFSQPNLMAMIEEAELAFYGVNKSQSLMQLPGSYIVNEKTESKFPAFLLSSDNMTLHIKQLLIVCQQALGTVMRNAQQSKKTNFSTSILSIFGLDSLSEVGFLSNAANWKKTEQQLQDSMRIFSEMFDVPIPDLDESNSFSQTSDSNPLGPEAPDCYADKDGSVQLSSLGRFQMMNNIKKFPVLANCDPETQPIQSNENAMLVRLFYKISSLVNTKYATQLQDLCEQSGWVGRAANYYLRSQCQESQNLRLTTVLPPRISLRFLASYKTLFYVFLFLVLYRLFGGSMLGGLFYLLFLSSILSLVRMLRQT